MIINGAVTQPTRKWRRWNEIRRRLTVFWLPHCADRRALSRCASRASTSRASAWRRAAAVRCSSASRPRPVWPPTTSPSCTAKVRSPPSPHPLNCSFPSQSLFHTPTDRSWPSYETNLWELACSVVVDFIDWLIDWLIDCTSLRVSVCVCAIFFTSLLAEATGPFERSTRPRSSSISVATPLLGCLILMCTW